MSSNEKLFLGFAVVVAALAGTMMYLLIFDDDGTGSSHDPYLDSELLPGEDRSTDQESGGQNNINDASQDEEQEPDNRNPTRHTEQLNPTHINVTHAGQIVGRVVNEKKRPLSRAKVILYRERPSRKRVDDLDTSPAFEVLEAETDFEGSFFFSNVKAPASYRLMAVAEGHVCINRPMVKVFPKKTQTTADLVMGEGWEVRGTVRDAKGRTIEGASAFLELDSGDRKILAWLDLSKENGAKIKDDDEQKRKKRVLYTKTVLKRSQAETDEKGRFSLGVVAAGTYRVGARAKGYSMVINKKVVAEEANRKSGVDVDLVLEPAKAIRGLVMDTDQNPIEGVEICAERDKDPTLFSMARTLSMEKSGQFTLSGIHPGRYIISARKRGYLPTFATNVEDGTYNVTLIMPRAATCTGRVIASDTGKPLKRFSVAICSKPPSPAHELRQAIRPWESFENRDGKFKLDGMQRGNYVLVASADGYGLGRSDPFALNDSEDSGPFTIRLPKGYSLRGHVEDLLGAPIQGARVVMGAPNPGSGNLSRFLDAQPSVDQETNTTIYPSAETNRQGQFLIQNALQGIYSLKITHPDFEELVVPEIEVKMKKVNYAGTMALAQGCTLECTVFTRWGKPVPGAIMMVRGQEPNNFYLVHTDSEGTFKIVNLSQGEYKISLRSGGIKSLQDNSEGKPAPSSDMQVFLSEGQKTTTEFHMK